MKIVFILIVACVACGCAAAQKRDFDRRLDNVQQLFNCQYRAADSAKLTPRQTFDLQAGCYDLYKMRGGQ